MGKTQITLGLVAATLLNVCGCVGFYGPRHPLEGPPMNPANQTVTGTSSDDSNPFAADKPPQPIAANQSGLASQAPLEKAAFIDQIKQDDPGLYDEMMQARQKMTALQTSQPLPTNRSASPTNIPPQNNQSQDYYPQYDPPQNRLATESAGYDDPRSTDTRSRPNQRGDYDYVRREQTYDAPEARGQRDQRPNEQSKRRPQERRPRERFVDSRDYRDLPLDSSSGAFVDPREMQLGDELRRMVASGSIGSGGFSSMQKQLITQLAGRFDSKNNIARMSHETSDQEFARRGDDSYDRSARDERDRYRNGSERDDDKRYAQDEPITLGQWRKDLGIAIDSLKEELYSYDGPELDPQQQTQMEILLRLLYAADNRKEEALDLTSHNLSLSKDQREYWTHQIHSLLINLDEEGMPEATRRASLAMRELRDAVRHLSAASKLDLHNLAFCTLVEGFGQYEEFEEYTFKPDEETLLYFEVDNFSVNKTAKGHSTKLQGSCDIIDADGVRVASLDFPLAEETVRNPRRDYFIRYRVYIPKHLSPGEYTLQLTLEDKNAKKFGQGSIVFNVKEK